jgi:hypothetical protein
VVLACDQNGSNKSFKNVFENKQNESGKEQIEIAGRCKE